jgi:1-acyl-sn-glycerol-3-phosphate acyltransferase
MTILYKGLHSVANTVERLFFNSFTVTFTDPAQQSMPTGGLVVMANHNYHMNDSATIQRLFGLLGRNDIYFVAYSTLYQGMFLGWLYSQLEPGTLRTKLESMEDTARLAALREFHMLPIHREKDGKGDFHSQKQNLTDFIDDAARKAAEGHVVVIYPDGGSPDGYAHDPVKAGAARMALRAAELGKELGNQVSLVCLGITYSSFHEPMFSDVEVRIASSESLTSLAGSPAEVKRNRKPLMKRIEQKIRAHIVQAPRERTRAIEVLGSFVKAEGVDSTHLRVKRAADRAHYLAEFEPHQWALLSNALIEYGDLATRLHLQPAADLAGSNQKGTWSTIKALSCLFGILPFIPALLLIGKMTDDVPAELHRRGQQLMGTAASVLLVWSMVLGVADVSLVGLGVLGAVPGILGYASTITGGVIAAKNFNRSQLALLSLWKPQAFLDYRAKGAEITTLLASYPSKEIQ